MLSQVITQAFTGNGVHTLLTLFKRIGPSRKLWLDSVTRAPEGGVILIPDAYILCRRRSRLLSLEVHREHESMLRKVNQLTMRGQS